MFVFDNLSEVSGVVNVRTPAAAECCLALWVGRAPEPEPLRARSRALERGLDARTRLALASLDEHACGWPLHAFNWCYRTGLDEFEACLEAIEDDPAIETDDHVAVGEAEGVVQIAAPTLPTWARSAIVDVLRAFWTQGFAEVWSLEADNMDQLQTTLARRLAPGLCGLANLSPRAFVDVERDRLVFAGGQRTTTYDCAALEGVDVVPSFWLRKRVVLGYGGDRVAIALGMGRAGLDQLSSREMARLMGVLAHRRRVEILQLCTTKPRATQELAQRLGITEGPVSRHLKELEQNGLVLGQRFGRYVTYTAIPETIASLARQLDRLPRDVVLAGGESWE